MTNDECEPGRINKMKNEKHLKELSYCFTFYILHFTFFIFHCSFSSAAAHLTRAESNLVAGAGADLMEFDHVPERVLDKDLL